MYLNISRKNVIKWRNKVKKQYIIIQKRNKSDDTIKMKFSLFIMTIVIGLITTLILGALWKIY